MPIFNPVFGSVFRPVFSSVEAGSGWNVDFTRGEVPQGLTFIRASSGSYFDASGVLRTASTDVPRLDTNPVTLQPRGLLIEGARTNLAFPSETGFSGIGQGCTYTTQNTDSMLGLNSPTKLMTGTNTAVYPHSYTAGTYTLVSGKTYVSAFDFKPVTSVYPVLTCYNGTNDIIVKFNATGSGTVIGAVQGTPVNVGIEKLNFGFYRVFMTFTATANVATQYASQIGFDSVGGLTTPVPNNLSAYICRHQFEEGVIPSSYIPTTSAAVTRAADYAYIMLSALGYNFNEGTLVLEYEIEGDTGTYQNLYTVSNAAGTVYMASLYMLGETTVRSTHTGGPVFDLRNQSSMRSPSVIYKHGISYKTNDTSTCLNGGAIANSVSCAMQTTMDRIVLASAITAGTNPGNMWIRKVTYLPNKISNDDLKGLTQ